MHATSSNNFDQLSSGRRDRPSIEANTLSRPGAPALKITRSSTFRPAPSGEPIASPPQERALRKKMTLFQALKNDGGKPKSTTYSEAEEKAFNRNKQQTIMVRNTDKKAMDNYYKQVRPDAPQKSATSDHAAPKLKVLAGVLTQLDEKQRYDKAARHFFDARYQRAVRHDIDEAESNFVRKVYFLQTNPHWQTFLYLVSWIYLAIGFVEPYEDVAAFHEENPTQMGILFGIKGIAVALYAIELFLDVYHRSYTRDIFKEKFLKNKKLMCKIVLTIIFILDFAFFYNVHLTEIWRITRCLRPFILIFHSKQLSRTFFGIIGSLREILTVTIFFFIISLLVALAAIRVLGDLGEEVKPDKFVSNFKEFGPALNSMFILLTNDNYPEIALPATLEGSRLYLLFFIPYMLFHILLLVPIPIAVIFDAFRKYRSNLVVEERLKEREAFVACFLTIDVDGSKSIGIEEFMSLCQAIYKDKLNTDKAEEIFEFAEKDASDQLALGAFFEVMEIMESSKDLKHPGFNFAPWNLLRKTVNKIFRFDKLVRNPLSDFPINIGMFFNAVLIMIYGITQDEDLVDVLDMLDRVLIYLFMAEMIIRVFGYGFTGYFFKILNTLDSVITIFSFIITIPSIYHEVEHIHRLMIIFHLTRAQRILKLLRAIKSFKYFRFCSLKVPLFNRTLKLLENIVLCLPTVLKLAVILFMFVYFYAIIGMELFPSKDQVHEESPYMEHPYTNFESLGFAFLSLFHVIGQATWSFLLSDFAYRFDNLLKASLFFNSFYVIANRVIISLLTGLVWEVFAYMGKFHGEKEKLEEKLSKAESMESSKPKAESSESDSSEEESEESDEDSRESRHFDKKKHSKTLTANQVAAANKKANKNMARKSEYHPKTKPIKNQDKAKVLEALLVKEKKQEKEDLPAKPKLAGKSFSLLELQKGEDEFNLIELMDKTYNKNNYSLVADENKNGRLELSIGLNTPKRNKPLSYGSKSGRSLSNAPAGEVDYQKVSSEEIMAKKMDDNVDPTRFTDESEAGDFMKKGQKPQKRLKTNETVTRIYMESDLDEEGNTHQEVATIQEPLNFGETRKLLQLQTKKEELVTFLTKKDDASPFSNASDSEHKYHSDSNTKGLQIDSSYDQDDQSSVGEGYASAGNSPQITPINGKKIRNPSQFARTVIHPVKKSAFKGATLAEERISFTFNHENNASLTHDHESKEYSVSSNIKKTLNRQGTRGSHFVPNTESSKFAMPILVRRSTIGIVQRGESLEVKDEVILEKEFYMRKITICEQVSSVNNQLDYVFDPTQKDKFSHEFMFLNIEWIQDENEPKGSKNPATQAKKLKFKANLSKGKILRKALLESADEDTIQKHEESHFKSVYGEWFDHLENVKLDRVMDIFKTENNILIRIMRLLKRRDIVMNDFVEITWMIENSINVNLLRKGSFGKFIFKDVRNKWFTVYKDAKKVRIQYIGKGFWNYFNDVFGDKTQLYEGQDMLFSGAKKKYDDVVNEFHNSLKGISNKLPKNVFSSLDRNHSVWNMYAVPFETSDAKQLRTTVSKEATKNPKTNLSNVPKRMITQGVFVSMNFITKMSKKAKEGVRLSRLENMPLPNKNFFAATASGPNTPKKSLGVPQQDALELLSASGDQQQNQVEKPAQDNTDEFLPLQEYIDFLRDVRDITNIYKDHMLTKLSLFYLNQDLDKADKPNDV